MPSPKVKVLQLITYGGSTTCYQQVNTNIRLESDVQILRQLHNQE